MIFREKAFRSLAPVRIFNVPVDRMSFFYFKNLKFSNHIFRNQRDSKILSIYFDVKINPITFSIRNKNYKQNLLIAAQF